MRRPKEGDVFEVDLGEGLGTVRGVIARKKGPGHLVYAFLPGHQGPLSPETADHVGIVGDQGFRDGSWQLREPVPGFSRERWPIPKFGRLGMGFQGSEGPAFIITLDDSLREIEERRVSREEAGRLPQDGVDGAAAAVIGWRKLARQAQQHRPAA